MLKRAFQPAADKPRVESVVAVLDQDRPQGKPKECAPGVFELGRADEHRPVDVVALARVWVDGCAAIDQRVKEGKRAAEAKALGAHLEDQERSVTGRLDVEGDELGVLERRLTADLRGVDSDLLPRHELGCPARLEIERSGAHQRASARARLAQAISSPLIALSSRTATA
jgi:hypothetical protein